MGWKIEFDIKAKKELKKLSKHTQQRIYDFLNKLTTLSDPRIKADFLQGKFHGFWKYRIGDYRIVCEVEEEILTVLVIHIGHRKDIYK